MSPLRENSPFLKRKEKGFTLTYDTILKIDLLARYFGISNSLLITQMTEKVWNDSEKRMMNYLPRDFVEGKAKQYLAEATQSLPIQRRSKTPKSKRLLNKDESELAIDFDMGDPEEYRISLDDVIEES